MAASSHIMWNVHGPSASWVIIIIFNCVYVLGCFGAIISAMDNGHYYYILVASCESHISVIAKQHRLCLLWRPLVCLVCKTLQNRLLSSWLSN